MKINCLGFVMKCSVFFGFYCFIDIFHHKVRRFDNFLQKGFIGLSVMMIRNIVTICGNT